MDWLYFTAGLMLGFGIHFSIGIVMLAMERQCVFCIVVGTLIGFAVAIGATLLCAKVIDWWYP